MHTSFSSLFVAPFLVCKSISTHEGASYLKDKDAKHLTSEEFKEAFDSTERAKEVKREINEPVPGEDGVPLIEMASDHFQNSSYRSMKLLAAREMLLWWRDKYQIKARIVQGSCSRDACADVAARLFVWSISSRFRTSNRSLDGNHLWYSLLAVSDRSTSIVFRFQ